MSCFFALWQIVEVLKSDYNNEGENKARREMQKSHRSCPFPFPHHSSSRQYLLFEDVLSQPNIERTFY